MFRRGTRRISTYRWDMKTCDFCGCHEADPQRLLAWTTAVERGRAKSFCEACSRRYVRSMEAKLDSDWWA